MESQSGVKLGATAIVQTTNISYTGSEGLKCYPYICNAECVDLFLSHRQTSTLEK